MTPWLLGLRFAVAFVLLAFAAILSMLPSALAGLACVIAGEEPGTIDCPWTVKDAAPLHRTPPP